MLGHEGAGIVAEVGADVTTVQAGRPRRARHPRQLRHLPACNTGHPTWCRQTMGSMGQPFTVDGEPAWNFAATSLFAERTVVKEIQAVRIPDDVPLTSACLIGCGVLTGAGAALNRAHVQQGETVAVFGVGGVGLNAIQGLRIAGPAGIIAVDTIAAKEPLARQFGATDFIDATDSDTVEAIREPAARSQAGGSDRAFGQAASTGRSTASATPRAAQRHRRPRLGRQLRDRRRARRPTRSSPPWSPTSPTSTGGSSAAATARRGRTATSRCSSTSTARAPPARRAGVRPPTRWTDSRRSWRTCTPGSSPAGVLAF